MGRVAEKLHRAYGEPDLGNMADPLDELIYIILSASTSHQNFTATWATLRASFPTWGAAAKAGPTAIERAIRRGGLGCVKARQIAAILERTRSAAGGEPSLDFLRGLGDDEAERFLCALPGVGVKTARCVLMYSLGRLVFPVDAHVFRVMTRLGEAPPGAHPDRRSTQDYLQSIVPPRQRYSLHVNMVAHGRAICRARRPDCPACPLNRLCPKVGAGD